jgi:ComF family protein
MRLELRTWGTRLADLLSPPSCLACGAPLGAAPSDLLLCAPCAGKIRPVDARLHCRSCLRPLAAPGDGRHLCLACRAEPPPVDRLLAVWWYESPLAEVLRRLKYGRLEALARPLVAASIAREICVHFEAVDLVAPVPLPLWRQLGRGFNQAESLACPLAERLARPLFDGLRRRLGATARQARLGRAGRLRLLAAGFRLRAASRERLAGKSVLLVDDIVTTGATLRAAAAALRRGGAREVLALALAATPERRPWGASDLA